MGLPLGCCDYGDVRFENVSIETSIRKGGLRLQIDSIARSEKVLANRKRLLNVGLLIAGGLTTGFGIYSATQVTESTLDGAFSGQTTRTIAIVGSVVTLLLGVARCIVEPPNKHLLFTLRPSIGGDLRDKILAVSTLQDFKDGLDVDLLKHKGIISTHQARLLDCLVESYAFALNAHEKLLDRPGGIMAVNQNLSLRKEFEDAKGCMQLAEEKFVSFWTQFVGRLIYS